MLQAVPAQPAGLAAIAPDLAPTPRQRLGSGRRGHSRIADGQRPPQVANRAGRSQPHRRRRRPAALPWPVRSRATFLRCDLPQVVPLPDRRRNQPRPHRSKLYGGDEPTAPLTAPMQTARPHGSRSSPAAAQRCAPRVGPLGRPRTGSGAGLDRDPRGRRTLGRAVRCGATNQPLPPRCGPPPPRK